MLKKSLRIVLLIALSFLLLACTASRKGFEGKEEGDENHYYLSFEVLNKTLSHDFEMKEGESLQIHFDIKEGDLKIVVKKDDGEPIYEGNGQVANDFTINIQADGIYTASVTGKNAKGEISFTRK